MDVGPPELWASRTAGVRGCACLVIVAHQGPAAVLGAQEPVHQHGPPEREMELDVLLKVSTQLVTVEVVAEGEALPRDQHVHLTPHGRREEGLQAVCQEEKGRAPQLRVLHQGRGMEPEPTAVAKDVDGSAQKPGPEEGCGTGVPHSGGQASSPRGAGLGSAPADMMPHVG